MLLKITNKWSFEISRRKFGFEGPTDLFLKQTSKNLTRLCLEQIVHISSAIYKHF